jgi:membrane associated rhomboid family serine protease
VFGLVPFSYLSKPVKVILLLNVAVFLLELLGGPRLEALVVGYGALFPYLFFEPWRILTYAFIHGGFFHLFFNMLMFWMFAPPVEEELGTRSFVALYLFSAVFAGLVSIACYALGITDGNPIIGASGALFGVMVAYGALNPNQVILLFFVIPLKMRIAIWVFIAIDILFANSGDGVAHFTHLGGVAAGFLFMYFWRKGFRMPRFEMPRPRAKPRVLEGEFHMGTGKNMSDNERLDSILKKISTGGMGSLSQNDVDFLHAASEKRRRERGA